MGWFDRLIGREVAPAATPIGRHPAVSAYADWLSLDDLNLPEALRVGSGTRTGRTVGERHAMGNATLNRAVTLICGTMGQLPCNLLRRLPDGSIEKAEGHPVQKLLRVSPNPLRGQKPYEFKNYMQGRALLKGNAYAFKVPGTRGVQALVHLDPDRVTIEQRDDWTLVYHWQPAKGARRTFQMEDIFHLRAPWSSDGITGDGLLRLAAEALALADATDEAAGRMLRNGSYIGGTLSKDGNLTAEAAERLKAQFVERTSGVENANKWIVLEEGLKAEQFGANGREAEGLGQRKHQAEEIARFTGVPRPLLMFDDTSWGTGIEQLGLYFVIYCLMPWFVAWEETIAQSLLTEKERETHFAKFNEAALLRGSLKDQAEFLSKMLGGPGTTPAMVPNEAREKMELPPIDGGDRPNWGQMDNGDSNGTT